MTHSGPASENSSAPATDFRFVPQASAIAREAGARLREFLAQGVETEYKGDVDLVTVADRTVEKLIRARLSETFPDHGIYGEEGTRERLDQEFRWYVDPLDGTTNFAHGVPHFCVSLGLEQRLPALPRTRTDRGCRRHLRSHARRDLLRRARSRRHAEQRPMHVSRIPHLAESLVATGFPSRKRHDNPNVHFYHEFTLRSHGVRRAGSAALDLAYVACGRFEAFWEFHLNPWDTAAGFLLVEEAGGRISDFAGGPFRLDSREVLATNSLIHAELVALFQDMFAGRGLSPIPTPREFAAKRAERAQKMT